MLFHLGSEHYVEFGVSRTWYRLCGPMIRERYKLNWDYDRAQLGDDWMLLLGSTSTEASSI